jgi:hypothetical protein
VPDDGKWAIGVTEFKDEDIVDAEVVGEEPAAGARAEVVGEPAVRFGQVDTGGVEPVKDKVVDPSVEGALHEAVKNSKFVAPEGYKSDMNPAHATIYSDQLQLCCYHNELLSIFDTHCVSVLP